MEAEGAVNIIRQLHTQHGARVTKYLGDGDSKGYKRACDEFKSWNIEKLNCVNHHSKNLGNRLRKRIVQKSDVIFEETEGNKKKKGIAGVGGLTGKNITRIVKHHGRMVRKYGKNPELLRKRILAIYKHTSATDDNPDHDDCDAIFCKYLQNIAKENPPETYSHSDRKNSHIPPYVMKHVKDIFDDMADVRKLKSVEHALTQNANECFNSTLWNVLPKSGFANLKLVQFATNIAICSYNEGKIGCLDVFKSLGIDVRGNMVKESITADQKRVSKKRKSDEKSTLEARKKRKMDKINAEDKNRKKEGPVPSYGPGEHHD